jgi:hypothetical protein
MTWSKFNWFRTDTSDFSYKQDNEDFASIKTIIFWLRELQVASQEGLFSMELVRKFALEAHLQNAWTLTCCFIVWQLFDTLKVAPR